jgi:hypothetical protein
MKICDLGSSPIPWDTKRRDNMNTMKFKALLEALDSLPSEIKNNIIDMASTHEPACGTPGCFAGLISIVAKDYAIWVLSPHHGVLISPAL